MTVTEPADLNVNGDKPQQSLSTAAARNLATTTKSEPQMQGISSRWLQRLLPWVEATGGAYRVNRRLSFTVGDGRVTFTTVGSEVKVIPQELRELPLLRDFDNDEVLSALADQFVQREFEPGDVIVERGRPAEEIFLIAHGKADKIGVGEYGAQVMLGVLAGGDHFSYRAVVESDDFWEYTVKAVTPCTVLGMSQAAFEAMVARSDALRTHVENFLGGPDLAQNASGEAEIALASGHDGEVPLPSTFVDYEVSPREYELSVAQTVLRIHTRISDLYNQPMNQFEQQLRLTIEALRERQEHELVNNREFGLLHNADLSQRIHSRTGPPTPDDMDDLLALVWKEPAFFLAHPRAIAAFTKECTRRGIYPNAVDVNGHQLPGWRGVPIFPCGKIPVSGTRTSSIMLMRTGQEEQGVIGLRQTGIPDEYQPGLNVRFMGINEKAIASYLVSAYYSAAILVPDALGVLENVEVDRQ